MSGKIRPFSERYMNKIGVAPGLRRLVNLLREHGFDTSDSGDGSGMGFPPEMSNGANVIAEAYRMQELLRSLGVELVPQTEKGDEPAIEIEYDLLRRSGHIMLVNLMDADVWP